MVMVVVGDLSGSGGTERQFSDLHECLAGRAPGRVAFVTTRTGLAQLREAGRLRDASGVITLALGSRPAMGRLAVIWMTARLLAATLGKRYDVVHLCQPTPIYVPYAAILTRLPRFLRPLVTMTVTDCTVAPNLMSGRSPADLYEKQVVNAHRLYFTWSRLDGVYSWYQAFVAAARQLQLLPRRAHVTAARFCFTDVRRFQPSPSKEKTVIFAGRLSAQKRPLLFIDAVASLRLRHRALAEGWRFVMYGSGRLEAAVRQRLAEQKLEETIVLAHTPDMSPVFAKTRLFVSTQEWENFTSLAMLEAMAAGNAVIAQDVGQTNEFVRHGENGFVVPDATADGFADAIAEYLRHPEQHDRMARASRSLATDVHNIDHFAEDITAFWESVIKTPPRA